MEGPDKKPLLVLSREGEGRVGLLLSDLAAGVVAFLDEIRLLPQVLAVLPEPEVAGLLIGRPDLVEKARRQCLLRRVRFGRDGRDVLMRRCEAGGALDASSATRR